MAYADAEIVTDLVYSAIQEFGGVVKPKTAQYLHFFVDGKEVFAKRVYVPPSPYMRPAAVRAGPRAVEEIAKVLRTAILRAAGG